MSGERGSALILAVLIMAVLTLLGVSYLLIGDTENKIAENERLSAQALYFAEGAVREVKRWFDRPPYSVAGASNLTRPTTAVMDRTMRFIDLNGPGPGALGAADGSTARPYYKVGIDNDHDGADDIFDKPYRNRSTPPTPPAEPPTDMFVGTESGPDIRMDRATGGATAAFLDALSEKIMPGFPAGGAGILARVKEINVYAPPYLDSGGGTWIRYGVATVSARVQIIRTSDSMLLADRTVKAVVNETPYATVFGPLHSCDELAWDNVFRVRWGPATAAAGADMLGGPTNGMARSISRDIPATPKVDLLAGHLSPAGDGTWTTLSTSLDGISLEDPWFRFFSGLGVVQWNARPSPQAFPQDVTNPDESNKFQNYPNSSCPEFNYETWKSIARSGGSDVHYYAWDPGTSAFVEPGGAGGGDFQALTDGKTGLFFFDTRDGLAPHTFDAGNVAFNLTPTINITDPSYGVRGFVYANTEMWRVTGSPGRPATFTYPGEPFRDVNEDGIYQLATEGWINLNYNSIANLGDPLVVDSADTYNPPPAAPAVVRNPIGPSVTHDAVVWGILYLSGQFDASGTPYYNGSVVTYAGTETGVKTAGTASLYWDPNIKDNWPPPGWDLPRVIVTRWQTDD